MSIRRISFFGGPHSRKSTIAAKLFGDLKELKYEVENVQEYIKEWTYTNRFPESFDQVFLLAEQIRREDIFLRSGVPLIITDCPPLINSFYTEHTECPFVKQSVEIAQMFDEKFPSLNIFINVKRDKDSYNENGRFHSFEEAQYIDGAMLAFIIKHCGKDNVFALPGKYDVIKEFVLEKLDG